MRMYLVSSGVSIFSNLATVASFEEAIQVVRNLDARFQAWAEAGFPELPDNDPLHAYEGSDIYLEDGATSYVLDNSDGEEAHLAQWKRL